MLLLFVAWLISVDIGVGFNNLLSGQTVYVLKARIVGRGWSDRRKSPTLYFKVPGFSTQWVSLNTTNTAGLSYGDVLTLKVRQGYLGFPIMVDDHDLNP